MGDRGLNEQYRPGDHFGKYEITRRLGSGGFGTVWHAIDQETGTPVALKLLSGSFSTPDAARLRAEVELLAASASSESPHVVRVLDGGAEPVPFVVMEYVDGEDLAAVLRREGRLPSARVLEIARSIADALRVLGDAGIIHRDLKPGNVMIDDSGTVKLADFGIAKIVGFDTVTATGQVLLSVAYSAPEVWEGQPGAQSDLYAMGALLFECLVGHPPFVGSTAELFRKHLQDAPDTAALPSDTPRALRELIEACLQKSTDLRPASAAVCLEMIKSARVAKEPDRFGDWAVVGRHPSRAFSYVCRHATSGQTATVDAYFSDRVELGESLRRALAANPQLVPLGAERLHGTNRLVLHPDEAWEQEPPGRFAFWLARDEVAIRPPTRPLDVEQLRASVDGLRRLRDAMVGAGLAFEPRTDDLVAGPEGTFHLRRPGAPQLQPGGGESSALAAIRQLPLTDEARELARTATDLDGLMAALGGSVAMTRTIVGAPIGDPTMALGPSDSMDTVVGQAPPVVQTPSSSSARAPRESPPWLRAGAIIGGVLVLAAIGFALTRGGGGDDALSPEQVGTAGAATTTASTPPLAATQLATPAPASAGGTFRGGPERSGLQPGPAPAAPHPGVDWFVRAGTSVTSSPAVADGRVVLGDTDGTLHVYDVSDGREVASFAAAGPIRSSPAVEGGVAYFGSDGGHVYAVDVESGSEVWSFDAGSGVVASPAVVADTVYIVSDGGRVLALDAMRGALVWEVDLDTSMASSLAITDSVAFAAGMDGVLHAYDARTGAERWSVDAGAPLSASPAVARGVIYVGDENGILHALNAETGAETWTFPTGGPIHASAAAAGGVVFVASTDNYLYAVNVADGSERWRYRSGGPIDSSPALVTGNEVRYVATLGAAETVPPKDTAATGSFTITLDPQNRTAFYTLFVPEIEQATIAHIHLGPPGVAGPAIVTLLDTTDPLSTIDTTSTFDGTLLAGPLAGDFDGLVTALEAGELYLNVHTVRNPAEEIRGQLVPDATGIVFVGSGDGQLHAVDAGRGVKLWSFQTGGAVTSSPAIVDGRIFFGSGDGHVYTLGGE